MATKRKSPARAPRGRSMSTMVTKSTPPNPAKSSLSASSDHIDTITALSPDLSASAITSVAEFGQTIEDLDRLVIKIDQCTEAARAAVWHEVSVVTKAAAFDSDAKLVHTPLFDDRCSSKFEPYYRSLTNEPNTNYSALDTLKQAFAAAEAKNDQLYQSSPALTEDPAEETTNSYLVPTSLLLSTNLWGYNLSSVLQQMALLASWMNHLDRLPNALRKQIWEICSFVPAFKQATAGIKLSNFSKVIRGWTNNPIANMLAITTLFSSIGYLVSKKVLKNEYYYPNSKMEVFKLTERDQSYLDALDYEDEVAYKQHVTKRAKSHHGDGERVPSLSPVNTLSPQSGRSSSQSFTSPSSYNDNGSETYSDSEDSPMSPVSVSSSSYSNDGSMQSIGTMIDVLMKKETTTGQSNSIFSSHPYNRKSSSPEKPAPSQLRKKNILAMSTSSTASFDDPIQVDVVAAPTPSNNNMVSSLDALALMAVKFEELDEEKPRPSLELLAHHKNQEFIDASELIRNSEHSELEKNK
eukprot:gene3715-4282_t